jgi:hypothetical protein
MESKSKTEDGITELVQEAMDEVKEQMIGVLSKQLGESTGLLQLEQVKNRKHWWQLWKPRWRYPQLESTIKLNIESGTSMPKREGRVIKAKHSPEYEPNIKTKGGRVVRQVPRQLKKIREGQEAVDDTV